MLDERGQDLRKKYGYIPCDLYQEACANDMEYAIADAAVANAARVWVIMKTKSSSEIAATVGEISLIKRPSL